MRGEAAPLLVIVLAALASACERDAVDAGQGEPGVRIGAVEDLGAIGQGEWLVGRDGGYTGETDRGLLWVFGDSVFTVAAADGSTWLDNSFSLSIDHDPAPRDLLPVMDDAGRPSRLLMPTADEAAFNAAHAGDLCDETPCGARYAQWPGPVVRDAVRQRTLLFHHTILAEPGAFNFRGVGHAIAVWHDGEPAPVRPVVDAVAAVPTRLFTDADPAMASAALIEDDVLYAFACERVVIAKPCVLGRVVVAAMLTRTAWEFWDGAAGEWQSDSARATPLFDGNDILSVSFNRFLGGYVALYSQPLGREIHLRTAPVLTGPWSSALPVMTALPSGDTNGWVYDALAHAALEEDAGRGLVITYTRDVDGRRELRAARVGLVDGEALP